jgi:hypothetical protein
LFTTGPGLEPAEHWDFDVGLGERLTVGHTVNPDVLIRVPPRM